MLINLLYFIIISFFCISWGLPVILYSKKTKFELSFEELIFSFFLGLSVLSLITSWIVLFTGVRFEFLLLLSPFVVAINFWKYQYNSYIIKFSFSKLSKTEIVFAASCFLLFLFLSTLKSTMEDTGFYHLQNIKWAHTYGSVPGLANLYLRYGFYSNWFHLIALFQLSFVPQNFLYLNFTITIWAFLFFFYQYKFYSARYKSEEKHLAFYYFFCLLFMLGEWDLFRGTSSSTSYDFVVTINIFLCTHLLMKQIIFKDKTIETRNILLLLLISTPFYKLTGFLIAPVFFVLLLYINNKKKVLLISAILFCFYFVPFAFKNYLQTGYIFFPYRWADFFNPQWKVPNEMVNVFNQYIFLSNHYIEPNSSPFQIKNLSFAHYKNWFLHISYVDRIIVLSCFFALPFSRRIIGTIYGKASKKLWLFYGICVFAACIWLLTSPDTRFAFGILVFVAYFPLTGLFHFEKKWIYTISMIMLIPLIGYYLVKKAKGSFKMEKLLYSESANIPPYRSMNLNGHIYLIPEVINNNWSSRCYNCRLPCIYEINPFLKRRSKRLADGFIMNPMPDSLFVSNYRY
jgi:hypothetical protein